MALSDIERQQEEQLRKSYSQMRRQLGARQDVARNRLEEDLRRQEAATGGFGGASLKIRQKSLRDLETGIGEQEAGIGAQEAQQLAGLGSERASREFARQERIGSEQFAGEQNRLAREQQQKQFEATLGEQVRQFSLEFDENKKTNAINAAIAIRDAGLVTPARWAQLWGSPWQAAYQNVPGIKDYFDTERKKNTTYVYSS